MMAQGDKLLGFIAWLQNKKLCPKLCKKNLSNLNGIFTDITQH